MKERLDVLLVKRNLAESREKAKAIIMSGNVLVDGEREDKAGSMFKESVEIIIKGSTLKYVSRGGLKLEKAIEHYGVNLENKICMDVGSSTGGFTDCMLQNHATKVYAVDVGTNQLAWKLRQDERVICMEKTNIRHVLPEHIADPIDFVSIDVAFISLTKVMIPVRDLLKDQGEVVCLIKPQFEAGREKVGKKGVVRDKSVHVEVIEKIIKYTVSIGFRIQNLDYSPIKGPEGNIEYLLHLIKDNKDTQGEKTSKESVINDETLNDNETLIQDELVIAEKSLIEDESEDVDYDNTRWYENIELKECNQYVDNNELIDLETNIKLIVEMAHSTLKSV